MAADPLTEPTLDHLALASRRSWDNLVRYCDQLGARWLGGATGEEPAPFHFCHVRLADGAKLEFLEPLDHPGSDFLRRFLHRNGPGPHHLTFKVPDLGTAIDDVAAAGYSVVSENRENPDWQEAFLHPKQSHGIVIQLAQSGPDSGWDEPPPLPPSLQSQPPELSEIKHLVADLDAAVKLFSGPLAMAVGDQGSDGEGDFALLTQGPWKIRLIRPAPSPYRDWLGDRPGRVLQLSLAVDDPTLVSDLRRLGPDRWELPPELNQGTRVLLAPRSAS